jgi:endonuclease/exonuclease/phosphatase family metal-dependent hydrolase
MRHTPFMRRTLPLFALALALACPTTTTEPDAGPDGGLPVNPGQDGGPPPPPPGDLGWPLPLDLPPVCTPAVLDDAGDAWDGFANFQFPAETRSSAGAASEALFGQVFQAGVTEPDGDDGFEAQVVHGPYGTHPFEAGPLGLGACWTSAAAAFNVQSGNNDEHTATVTPAPGTFGMMFRFRPTGGAWRLGDLDGSDNGADAFQASRLLAVDDAEAARPFVAVTVNLKCRTDDWLSRAATLSEELAKMDPDVIAMQEDCQDDTGLQADDLRWGLAARLDRGYDVRRADTHTASHDEGDFGEGITILSAHPINDTFTLDLPFAVFPRKALAVNLSVRGVDTWVVATHFDFSPDADTQRAESANVILNNLPASDAILVLGDLNSTPDSDAIANLGGGLTDLWIAANPSDPGLTFPADAPERRIDYVFGTPAIADSLRGARVFPMPSDHRGVAVAFDL